jgi:hypothetical protein
MSTDTTARAVTRTETAEGTLFTAPGTGLTVLVHPAAGSSYRIVDAREDGYGLKDPMSMRAEDAERFAAEWLAELAARA